MKEVEAYQEAWNPFQHGAVTQTEKVGRASLNYYLDTDIGKSFISYHTYVVYIVDGVHTKSSYRGAARKPPHR